jgi:hypothetical protein
MTTLTCMVSPLRLHGIVQTLMASTLVVASQTSPVLPQPLVQVTTVSPLDLEAQTYRFCM